MQEIPVIPQLEHDMLPDGTLDERARQEFTRSFKSYIQSDILPGVGEIYFTKHAPKLGADADRHTIRKTMRADQYFQAYASLQRVSQEMDWISVLDTLERQSPDLIEKFKAYRDKAVEGGAGGSVRLDPDLEIPKYISAFDIHCMPGNYHTDYTEDDVTVGALYDRGVYIYAMGMMGVKNDDMGQSGAKYLQDNLPDFKPTRILDMGCTVGHSTLPYKERFPDAEVHGIDVGAPCLRYAHARAEAMGIEAHFSQQNAELTDFEDESFDLIVSHILFHETSGKALPAIVKECMRLLKPGGLMVHADLPPFENMDAFTQFVLDNETYYNNEPFWGAMREFDQVKLCTDAGFDPAKIKQDVAPFALLADMPPPPPSDDGDEFKGGEFAPGMGWSVLVAEK